MATLVFVGRYLTSAFIDELNANFAAAGSGGGGGGTVTVPGGGTGQVSLTAHGILLGAGTGAVNVTGPGTAGQVLTSNGGSADPSFQPGSGSSVYPPLPTPNLQTFLQNAANAGTFADWIWGDITVPAPIVVTVNDNRNDIGCDFHGAAIRHSISDVTKDVITWIVPNTATVGAQIAGLEIRNVTIWADNGTAQLNNCLTVSCPSHNNGIYGIRVMNVSTHTAKNSGLFFYGAVFEADIIGHFSRNCNFAGVELRNPPQGAGGVISSVNLFGGDLRINTYGLALTADIGFQEPSGCYVYSTNFIANNSAGIVATSGIQSVTGSHFENNCESNGGNPTAAIWITGGGNGSFSVCQAVHSNSVSQNDFTQITGGGGQYTFDRCVSFNEDTFAGGFTANLTGTGNVFASADLTLAQFSGPGAGWNINIPTVTRTLI